jgi:rhamnosyltransferase
MKSDDRQSVDTRPSCRTRAALVLPTINAGAGFTDWLKALRNQTRQPDKLLLIDSSSTDQTVPTALAAGFEIKVIPRSDFSHGGTRQMAVDVLDGYDLIIFLTQDAFLADTRSIERLLEHFADTKVAAVYGRQLPRQEASPIEAHARLFNYPDQTQVKGREDIPRLGIKTAFISNSFAAYRRLALAEVGGFPSHTIQNEDTYTASKMVLAGWKVVYAADATVYHSHPFSVGQEFRRYFDIGVFHSRDPWIRQKFGGAGGEGLRYVRSELKYLSQHQPRAIVSALIRNAVKIVGFKLGNAEQCLPLGLKQRLSMNKRYWALARTSAKEPS